MSLKNIITMRNYTYALILITSLILLATIVHNASADVQYYEEAWFLRNNTETIVDNVSAIVKTNDGIIHIKMNETYLNDYFNYVSAKSKEKERIRKKWGMNDTEIRKTREYPVHLYKKVYTKSENDFIGINVTLVDVSHKLKSRSVDLRTKNAYIDVKNIDIKNDDYVLKIGFHTITYDSGTNTITVTGYTEATPCNFTDIYNADVAGAWGVVTRQCTNQFCFNCRLVIGDGTTETWFVDSLKQIIFSATSTSGSSQKLFDVKSSSHFILGVCSSDVDKTTEDGCSLSYLGTDVPGIIYSNVPVEIYSSVFSSPNGNAHIYTPSGSKFYNVLFTKNIYLSSASGVFHNVVFQNSFYAMNDPTIESGSGKIRIESVEYGLFIHTGTTLINSEILQSGYADIRVFMSSVDHYFINVVCDWVIQWLGTSAGKIYRQYTFDLKVIDKDNTAINGATVKIWDKDNNLVVDTTTDANGEIATQTITRGYYNQANGNTLQDASPHLIKIEKAGYTTYEADFTLEEKTDWLIALNSAENGTTTETKLISTQVGARKTTMAAAFMLLSGMFMMIAIKRRQEDD